MTRKAFQFIRENFMGEIYSGNRNPDENGVNKKGTLYVCPNEEEKIGAGGGGSIFMSRMFRENEKNEVVEKQNKQFVTKIIDLKNPANTPESIQREYEFCRISGGDLRVKPPIIDRIKNRCIIPMGLLSGEDLYDCYEKLRDGEEEQLINVIHALLYALKTRVSDKGIVHRDLKPENIRIDLQNFKVTIFDFGLAKFSGVNDEKRPGTLGWAAPEVYDGISTHDKKADVFSMGRILSLLCGQADEEFYNDDKNMLYFDTPNAAGYLKLFSNRNWIRPLLQQMLLKDQNKRIDIDNALILFTDLVKKKYPLHQFPQSIQKSDDEENSLIEIHEVFDNNPANLSSSDVKSTEGQKLLLILNEFINKNIRNLNDKEGKGIDDKASLYNSLKNQITGLKNKAVTNDAVINIINQTATISHHRRHRTRNKAVGFFSMGFYLKRADTWNEYHNFVSEKSDFITDKDLKDALLNSLNVKKDKNIKCSIDFEENSVVVHGYEKYRRAINRNDLNIGDSQVELVQFR